MNSIVGDVVSDQRIKKFSFFFSNIAQCVFFMIASLFFFLILTIFFVGLLNIWGVDANPHSCFYIGCMCRLAVVKLCFSSANGVCEFILHSGELNFSVVLCTVSRGHCLLFHWCWANTSETTLQGKLWFNLQLAYFWYVSLFGLRARCYFFTLRNKHYLQHFEFFFFYPSDWCTGSTLLTHL